MNYQKLIQHVAKEVRDRAWPEPDGSVMQEQIDISYAAVLAKAIVLPIYKLDKSSATIAGLDATQNNGYLSYDLPDDLFIDREDLGVYQHKFDSVIYDVSQSMPINSFRMMAENSLYAGDSSVFSYEEKTRFLHVLSTDNTQDVELTYTPEPARPTDSDYNTTDVPLPKGELQPTIHLIAAHITGSRMRDSAGAQFQSILSRTYDTAPDQVVEDEQ